MPRGSDSSTTCCGDGRETDGGDGGEIDGGAEKETTVQNREVMKGWQQKCWLREVVAAMVCKGGAVDSSAEAEWTETMCEAVGLSLWWWCY